MAPDWRSLALAALTAAALALTGVVGAQAQTSAKTAKAAATGRFEPFKTSGIFDATAQNPAWLGEEPEWTQPIMPG